jgi:TonB family protein
VHALAMLEKQKGPRDLALLVPLNDLAEIETRGQKFAAALRYQQRALDVIETAYGADHPAVAHRLVALGVLAERARDDEFARASYERALQIRRKVFAASHPEIAESLYFMARLELRGASYERAQALYREALQIWQKAPPADRRALAAAQGQLARTEREIALLAPAEVAAEPLLRGAPEYPDAALRKKLEGWVRLSFTVDAKGQVKDARVVESQPVRVFDRAALTALSTWKYKPHLTGGEPVEQTGNEVVIRFVLPE